MSVLVILSSEVHTNALRKARALGVGEPLPEGLMNAMLDDQIADWVSRIWNQAEAALKAAYTDGMNAARQYIDTMTAHLSDLAGKFAKRADEVREIIAARLNAYLQQAIDGALQRVRGSISVGGRELAMTSVTIEQSVKFSGSLKASLEEICEFVAEGEISLSAEYGTQ